MVYAAERGSVARVHQRDNRRLIQKCLAGRIAGAGGAAGNIAGQEAVAGWWRQESVDGGSHHSHFRLSVLLRIICAIVSLYQTVTNTK